MFWEAPNRTETGALFPGVQPFYWEDSVGDSTANALSVRVRKRLAGGLLHWRPLHLLEIAGQRLDYRKWRADCGPKVPGAVEFPVVTNVAQNAFDLSAEAWLVQLSISATVLRLTICGNFPSAMSAAGSRARLRCAPSWEIGIGAATGPSASGLPFTPRILGNNIECEPGR